MIAQRSKLAKNQFGDTLVEVLLATVIFSVVISASFALVNRASRINQVSSERSEASNAMQTQAETLRYYRDLSNADPTSTVWGNILATEVQTTSPTVNDCRNYLSGASATPNSSNAFFFDASQTMQDYIANPGTGNVSRYDIWIEGYQQSTAPNNDYVDFYVNACWQGPGGTGPQQASLVYRLAL